MEKIINLTPFLGLDLYTFPTFMQDGFSPMSYNITSEGGTISSCNGIEKFLDKDNCKKVILHYNKDNTMHILLARNGNIEKDGIILLEKYYEPNDQISYINYQMNNTYITIICNGKSFPIKYDGNTVSILSEKAPYGKYIELHNERVFIAGDASNPDRVYYSAAYDPTDFSSDINSGYIDIPSWDSGKIQGIKSVFGDIVIFKDNCLYRIYGTYPGEFGVDKINSNVGCNNFESICLSNDKCYFLSDYGLCVYNGVNASLIEDNKIKMALKNCGKDSLAFDFDNKLYISCENKVYEYDYYRNIILLRKGYGITQFFCIGNLLYIINENGIPCKFDSGNKILDKNIECLFTTKDYEFSSKNTKKSIYILYARAKGNGSINIKINADCKNFSKNINLSEEFRDYAIPINAKGRRFNIEIANINGSSFVLDTPSIVVDIEED